MAGSRGKISLQLATADLDTTEAFYGGILELPVERSLTVPGAPEHLTIRRDDIDLMFVKEGAVLEAHPVLFERFASYPKGVGVTIHIEVTGIEGINDAILEEGMPLLYPLEKKPYGIMDLWCFDPDGYLVVLEERWR